MDGRTTPAVGRATPDDAATVIEIIADAFRDDPVLSWLITDPDRRHDIVGGYFATMVRHVYLPRGRIYLAEDASGAALCMPAGASAGGSPVLADLCMAWRLWRACGFAGLLKANTLQTALRANRPTEPHVYLHALGVRRSHQGRGIGSALMRQVTGHCDGEHTLAYLENSNARNLPLYIRHGFRVIREWGIPGGGPPVWFMAREPRHDPEPGASG